MTALELITSIDAPIEVCFHLSLSIDLELEAAKSYGIRATSGVTSGTIGRGERVGWQTRQFGIRVSHLSEITSFEAPAYFQDRMVTGIFDHFQHDHFFHAENPNRTIMRDVLRYGMPPWLFGLLSERLIVQRRLTRLLSERNRLIKLHAESSKPV